MKTLAFLMVLVPMVFAQDVLFEDDFDDGNANGWFEMVTGATYEVNGAFRYELSYSGIDSIYALTYRGDLGGSMSDSNYSVLVETITHEPTGKTGLNIRFDPVTFSGYALYLNYATGNYYILRYDSFTSYVMLGSYLPYQGGFVYDTAYWIRFECLNDHLRAKIWTGPVSPEPDYWMIVRVDDTYQNNGCLDLESLRDPSGTYFDTEFDNIVVTSFPVSLESSTWGAIKNSF